MTNQRIWGMVAACLVAACISTANTLSPLDASVRDTAANPVDGSVATDGTASTDRGARMDTPMSDS